MKAYQELLEHIMRNGNRRSDRTGTGTRSVFGYQMRVDLAEGFPLLTTKKVHFKSVATELLWMISGSTNNKWLNERGVTIWDEWATKEQCARFDREEGDLGPVYGHQWRNFGGSRLMDNTYARDGFDQLGWVIREIVNNGNSRRLIVTGWNPQEADHVALPPCHTLFQFYVNDGKLSCQLYQRSADVFLGVPFNLASYALLTAMIAQVTGLGLGEFIHTFGDVHLYSNHVEQAMEQLARAPRALPTLVLDPSVRHLENFTIEHMQLINYDPHPAIRAAVSV